MTKKCSRCKNAPPILGDAYCLACSAWEAIGRELQSSWGSERYRPVVTDLIVATGRQIRALRNLGEGTGQAADRESSRPGRAKAEEVQTEERPTLPRRRSREGVARAVASAPWHTTPKGKARDRREARSEEETEDEEEEAEVYHQPLGGGGHRKPPEPDGPPPGKRRREAGGEHNLEGDRKKRHREEREEYRGRERQDYKRRHRAGRKHQRLGRLQTDPFARVHRKLPSSFLDVLAGDVGVSSLDHL